MTRTLIDLNHVIYEGMITYPGLPGPEIRDYWTREASQQHYAPGTSFHIAQVTMVSNTGTYLDSPFHRFEGGTDLADLPLDRLADLEGVVIRWRDRPERAIDAHAFSAIDVRGKAVLIHTGWDAHWGTDRYFSGHPYLTAAAARLLADGGARLVGIDSLNIDDTEDLSRPAHTILLGAGIPIVEHLCGLDQLPKSGFRFFAVPARLRGVGSFPVRAFAIVER
ncbi:MAG: cyclase family protein [Anaerolineae bacterium]